MAFINWVAVSLSILSAGILLLRQDWRRQLGAVAVQYLVAAVLVLNHWELAMAFVKVLAGWSACAVLGLTFLGMPSPVDPGLSARLSRSFRLFSLALVALVTLAFALQTTTWMGLALPIAWGGLFLIGIGFLQLGFSDHPFQVILGLFTSLAGFEILYAAIESSVLVASLLAAVTLGIALTGAYLLRHASPEASDQ